MSSTPSSSPSRISGTTISLFDALSQAMWPGKAWTSSTRCTCRVSRGDAAHALAELDADAAGAALERAEHQLAADVAVEAGPVESGSVSQISAAALAMLAIASGSPATRPSSAEARSRYMRRLVGRLDLEVVHQSNVTFPRALLDRAALALLVDPLGLRGPARPRRLALGLDHMGSGDHFRQPAAGIGAVGLLRAEAPRGDESSPPPVTRLPAMLLQPLIGVRVKAEPEQVDAELDRGRDLVDVLPAGAGRGEEGFAERIFRDVTTSSGRIGATRRNSREAAR